MQYQSVDPWGGMRQGFSDFMGTMQYVNQRKRQDRVDKESMRRTQIMEEEEKRQKERFEHTMRLNAYQSVSMGYKMVDEIKDHKTYQDTLNTLRTMESEARKTSPEAADKYAELIKNIPPFDARFNIGMADEAPNRDGKFEVWKSQEKLKLLAQIKMLGGDLEKDKIKGITIEGTDAAGKKYRREGKPSEEGGKVELGPGEKFADEKEADFGTRTMTKTVDGKKFKRKVNNQKDFDASKDEGYAWGDEEEAKEKTTRQSFTDKDGNVTNVIFDANGKIAGIEPITKGGKAIGREGTTSTPLTAEEKATEKTVLDEAQLKSSINTPKFRKAAIDAAKELNPEWKYMSEGEREIATRKKMEEDIKQIYPNARFDIGKDGTLGWYDGDKLLRSVD